MLTRVFETEIESSHNAAKQAIQLLGNREMDHGQIEKQLANSCRALNHIDALISRFE